MHAIIVKKQNGISTKAKAQQLAHKYNTHTPGFVRETSSSYRVRILPKTKFNRNTFRTKIINKNVSIVYGKLN